MHILKSNNNKALTHFPRSTLPLNKTFEKKTNSTFDGKTVH